MPPQRPSTLVPLLEMLSNDAWAERRPYFEGKKARKASARKPVERLAPQAIFLELKDKWPKLFRCCIKV